MNLNFVGAVFGMFPEGSKKGTETDGSSTESKAEQARVKDRC